MSEWQPIETAPKDGRPIILFHPDWDVKRLSGGWDPHEMAWRIHGWECPPAQPVKWHPMPELPK